jgi:hypothetical protein
MAHRARAASSANSTICCCDRADKRPEVVAVSDFDEVSVWPLTIFYVEGAAFRRLVVPNKRALGREDGREP